MDDLLQVLIFKGYLIFFLWILVNRLGIPLPATPALLAAGALAGMGEWKIALVLALAVIATLAADTVWFELGRRYGKHILRLVCRAALDPEITCHRAEEFLARHGARSLLITKFIPGMNRTVLPLTGSARVGYVRFLTFDLAGSVLWAGAYSGLGYVFSDTLDQALDRSANLGWYAGVLLLAFAAIGVIFWRYAVKSRGTASAQLTHAASEAGNMAAPEPSTDALPIPEPPARADTD